MKLKLTIIIFSALVLSGCSKMASAVSLGYEHPYCETHGLNYQDAGVCGNPMTIYKYRYYINANSLAYRKAKGQSTCGN